tara:strand:+ start:1233 stop:1472 length:240 start_codon:yes stop_codon:yes gene_type:complete
MDVKQKAANARTLLANETFKGVLEDIKNDQIKVFLTSSSTDAVAREDAYSTVSAIKKIEHYLQSCINDEKMFDSKNKTN